MRQEKGSLRDQDEMSKSLVTRVILPMAEKWSKFFSQLTPVTSLNRAKTSIIRAGLQGKVTPGQITTLSYILMVVLPVTSFPAAQMMASSKFMFWAIVGISALLGYRLPYGFVEGKAKARQHEIRKALPFTLDLISISVEAGMALDGAMAIVMEKSTGPMADELALTLREIRLGKGRNEALIDMGNRIGLDELKAFVTARHLHRTARRLAGGRHPDPGAGNAHQAPSACRGKGDEDAGEDHDSARPLHLSLDVHCDFGSCHHPDARERDLSEVGGRAEAGNPSQDLSGPRDAHSPVRRTMSRDFPLATVWVCSITTRKRRFFGQPRQSHQKRRAQTTVEFALILIPFFTFLFAIIDYANVYYYDNALQNALRESARFATAGRVIQTNGLYEANAQGVEVPEAIQDTEGREASRNECIRYWFKSNCVINIPYTNISIFSASADAGNPPITTTNNGVLHLVSGYTTNVSGTNVTYTPVPAVAGPGNANDYVEIIANYTVGTITPILSWLGGYNGRGVPGGYNLRVSAIVKNEPATLNFLHTNIYSDEPNETAADQSK